MFIVVIIFLFLVFLGVASLGVIALSKINLFWTRNPMGQIKFADTNGRLGLIHNVPGRYENVNGYLVKGQRDMTLIESSWGLAYLGFPFLTRVAKFKDWSWVSWEQDPTTGKYFLKSRMLPYISEFFFQFPYGALVEKAEIRGNIRADLKLQYTIWIANPTVAFGLNHSFLELVIPRVNGLISELCRGLEFNEVKEMLVRGPRSTRLRQAVLELNGIDIGLDGEPLWDDYIDPAGLLKRTGILIIDVALVEVESEAAAALEAREIAELQGAATVATANAQATAAERKADAEKYAAERKAEADAYAAQKEGEGKAAALRALTEAEAINMERLVTALGGNEEAAKGVARLLMVRALENTELRAIGGTSIVDISK